ncbi:hypothetical protein AX774_g791 [Zancudomyces culisetae]|uniref:Uncharacterized protein n=1 Tax=Zancudomyces culisetae TaxID=1213189 RepID=A0A1R1PVM6_ZANCU|nr:hypothetical protein AX774_g1516 [Zancudomyces culisetae]OMH85659.1 hypothetical protein AX774_g791 [Zancudomyces culisetae]|eukprot:OMH84942.1 hypothetical protein AX774_g1516 [Zancudomyces culisetae]
MPDVLPVLDKTTEYGRMVQEERCMTVQNYPVDTDITMMKRVPISSRLAVPADPSLQENFKMGISELPSTRIYHTFLDTITRETGAQCQPVWTIHETGVHVATVSQEHLLKSVPNTEFSGVGGEVPDFMFVNSPPRHNVPDEPAQNANNSQALKLLAKL